VSLAFSCEAASREVLNVMITLGALACCDDLSSSIHARRSEHDLEDQAIQPASHHTIYHCELSR
jgi:hypothetical protein